MNVCTQSLFPQNVKEQLLKDKADEVQANDVQRRHQKQQKWGVGAFRNSIEKNLEDYLNHDDEVYENKSDDEEKEILTTKPIADVFEEATVMFADIVGFTGRCYILFFAKFPP